MKVYIVGPDTLIESMFKRRGFTVAKSIDHADIVVFTGGEDVSPALYGEMKLELSHCNPKRDAYEQQVFNENSSKFFVGICRGGQLLNVLSGGRLYQDVDNHIGNHMVYTTDGQELCEVTSTHHQMMIPSAAGRVMAVARESTTRVRARGVFIGSPFTDDTEIVFYPETKERNGVLCFQPHPEYKHEPTERAFFESLKACNDMVKDFLTPKESA